MDVRCERCKTEYEFDDARITEAGVTVKCTTCGHVFKVKKKALVVTVPVKPGELDQAHAPLTQSPSTGSSGEKAKEWKVRQANGNVFQFKELTTLQKWIVERKVSREDEISLTGESWKRLGNIAELASFFQVVEDAQKAAQLAALQSAGALGAVPLTISGSGYPAMPAPAQPEPVAPSQVIAVAPSTHAAPNPAQPPDAVPSPQSPITQPMMPVQPSNPAIPAQAPVPHVSVHVTTAPAAAPNPAMTPPPPPAAALGKNAPLPMAAPQRVKSGGGGAGKWIGLVLGLAVLGGGGFAGYQFWWLPQQRLNAQLRDEAAKAEAARQAAEKDKAAADARAREEEEAAKKLAPQKTEAADAGSQVAAATTLDAGVATSASQEGEAKAVPAKAKKEPVHDFNWYMAQGDRLRDHEKAEAALDAYGRAADLEPDRAEPIAGRGLALLDMGSKLQAEAAFQQALKVNAKYTVAIMGLAETYKAQGKKDEAIKYYQRYLEVAPQGTDAAVAKAAIQRLSE